MLKNLRKIGMILCVIMMMNLCVLLPASAGNIYDAGEIMYALDGRTLRVSPWEIEAYRAVGWYYGKPVTMYALDGRTLIVGENDIEMYRKVGWYYGKPVTMYALDGRTLTVGENDIEMYRQVGWYYGKPVTMYAPDGRTMIVGENDINIHRQVGWMIPQDMDQSGNILNLVYQFDYMDTYRNFIKYQGDNWTTPPPVNHLLPVQFALGTSYAKFQDAYAIDVDNDDVLELVVLFASDQYGAVAVYECENGQVTEVSKHGGYWYEEVPYANYYLYKNGNEYAFCEYEYHEDWETGIYYTGIRLDKGYEGILVTSKNFENYPEWDEYWLYNQPSDKYTVESKADEIFNYQDNAEYLLSASDYDKNGDLQNCDLAKGANLEKYCMGDIVSDLQYYISIAKASYIPDLILGAFRVYQYGYYQEAMALCQQIQNVPGITPEQKADTENIIGYCSEKIYADTNAAIERIRQMVQNNQGYEALAEIANCRKNNCTQEQLNQLNSLESICKEKIAAYETKMNQYTTIYAKSGMELYVQNKEVQGYLDSGVWFLTPQKTWAQMKQAAYQYAKTSLSGYLYYPNSARYPGINEVDFWLESQEGSQAVYVVEFYMDAWNEYGYYAGESLFTCTLSCNPYGFCGMEFEEAY